MIAPKLRFSQFKDEWKSKKLGEIGEFINGLTYSPSDITNDENQLLVLRSSNIQDSQLAFDDNVFVNLIVEKEKFTQENDILICIRNGSRNLIGKNTIIKNLPYKATHGAFMSIYRSPFNSFIVQLFQTDKYYQYINADLGATINSINGSNIKKYKFYFPSEKEQTKIAEFLSVVDDKISQLSRQLELLNQYKKGVMQKIFSQEIRFKNDNGEDFGEWDYLQLGELIEESKAVSKKQDEFDVLTSSRRGLIKQSEYFEGSRLIDRDNVGFNIIKPHEITYRSRSDDGLFYFNFNNLGITGIISTYYPVFSFKNSNNKFVTEYLNFNKADFSKYAVGTSQLVLSLNALRTVKLRIPSKPEQEKIAEFLTAIDERIYHTTAQLTQTKQWKKGLLQQMFI